MGSDIFNISIEWDDSEVIKAFEMAEREVLKAVEEGLIEDAEELVTASKALVQKEYGDLEDSITRSRVKTGMDSSKYIEVSANAPYALRRHEEPYRLGVYPKYGKNGAKDFYIDGRGKITRSKPDYMGMKPGRKYIERPLKKLSNKFVQNIADKIRGRLR